MARVPQWASGILNRTWVTPENTRHWTNVGLMLGRRRRRRSNIDPTLVQCLVFSGTFPHLFPFTRAPPRTPSSGNSCPVMVSLRLIILGVGQQPQSGLPTLYTVLIWRPAPDPDFNGIIANPQKAANTAPVYGVYVLAEWLISLQSVIHGLARPALLCDPCKQCHRGVLRKNWMWRILRP